MCHLDLDKEQHTTKHKQKSRVKWAKDKGGPPDCVELGAAGA